jgi:hypothetical protein
LKMLDLFSGLNGWNQPFRERGHDVTTLDIDPMFNADFQKDILDVTSLDMLGGPFDIVTASPPCQCFSVASIGAHWTGGWRAYQPKTEEARNALRIVDHLFSLLTDGERDFVPLYIIENPRGVMRKVIPYEPQVTWYCRWGETRAKPTDLWFNDDFGIPWDDYVCKNGNFDHEEARRGARTGTQGIDGAPERSLIPYQLALRVCIEAERVIGA